MRRENSSIKVDFFSEKGAEKINKTYFGYVPLEDMACYAVAEGYDGDRDINSAKLAVESVLTAFERNPSFWNLRKYIRYAHDEILANSVKNKLEVAITVVVTDYTRIRYASCGNIKFFLFSENTFYLKSETQTYYQNAVEEYGADKAPDSEYKNLIQYLGMSGFLRPFVSPKIEIPEECTMLFATCNFWERVDDIELLDAYEESDTGGFLSNLQEMYLLTQLGNPELKNYTIATLFVEKTFKEDTAKKKKRNRFIILGIVALCVIVAVLFVVISILRASDRRAISEIERLDSEGIRYSNYGNYSMAYEQYVKASELTGKLSNNLQFIKEKSALSAMIAERWHLFNSVIVGDEYMEGGEYQKALKSYEDAQTAYDDLYETAGIHSGLMVEDILTGKIKWASDYIEIDYLKKTGEMFDTEELYQDALDYFRQAESIVKKVGDLTLRKELMDLIFESTRKMNSDVEVNFIRNIQTLMKRAEDRLDYKQALQYCEFIIDIYYDLGISDNQSIEDRTRIEKNIGLDQRSVEQKKLAETAMQASRYDEAILEYENLLDIYDDMNISKTNERYVSVVREIAMINSIIEANRAASGEVPNEQ